MLENYKDILTIKELCEVLRIGKTSPYKLIRSGEIPSRIICGKYKIPKKAVMEYVEDFTKIA